MNKCFIEESNQLQRFHDGALDSASSAAIRGHVADCPSCQAALADYVAIGEALQGICVPSIPAGLTARLQASASSQRERRRRRFGWGLVAAASALLVSSLGLVHYSQSSLPAGPEVMAQWEAQVVSPPVEDEEFSDLSNRTLIAIHIPTHTLRENGNE